MYLKKNSNTNIIKTNNTLLTFYAMLLKYFPFLILVERILARFLAIKL